MCPTLIICFAPSYWCFHAQALKESLFFSEMWTSRVGVFLTGVQHLKLYSITRRRNILKDNLTIFHKSSRGDSWFRWCWNWLVEVTAKFQRYVIKMWFRMMVVINAQVTKKYIPGCLALGKALDFYRFAKFAKICLWLIYLISHSSIGMYDGLRSGSNSIITKTMWVVCKMIRVRVFLKGRWS